MYFSGALKDYDYFQKQKKNALTSSFESIVAVLEHLNEIQETIQAETDKKEHIIKLIKVSLPKLILRKREKYIFIVSVKFMGQSM